jgi:hypothetical protein
MLKEFDVVVLKKEVPGLAVPASTEGAIVAVYDAEPPGAYEVEFFDETGNTLSVEAVTGDNLELKIPYHDDVGDQKG